MIAWLHHGEAAYRLPRWHRPYRTAGSLTIDAGAVGWRPYLSVRATPIAFPVADLRRARLVDGFFVIHVWLVTAEGNVHVTVHRKRHLIASLRHVGLQLHTHPSWPGITIATPPATEVRWSYEL